MQFSQLPLNDNMRELTRHGSALFPIQYYVDEPSHFANHTIPLHWHPELEFWVANGGPVDVQVGKNTIRLEDGSGIFINGNMLHSFHQADSAQESQCPNIVFLDELIAPATSTIYHNYVQAITRNPRFPYIVLKPDCAWQKEILMHLDFIFSLFQKYDTREYSEKAPVLKFMAPNIDSPCYEMIVQNKLNQLWQILYSCRDEIPAILCENKEQLLQIRTQKMLRFIHGHYPSQISLAEIAASAGISISEACRCFQAYLHTPPISYLLNYRIEQAKLLLQNSMETVGQIGISCGFQSSGYFSKAFRKQTGMTPNQYRKQYHYSKKDS